jgi:hypothetical protein
VIALGKYCGDEGHEGIIVVEDERWLRIQEVDSFDVAEEGQKDNKRLIV